MEIILLERIAKLGQMGDIVNVKPGYGRNYLLPHKKALRATKENIAFFETQKKQLEADNLDRKKDAEKVAKSMKDISINLIRQAGESGQLYGSVTAKDIADKVTAKGFTISKTQVQLNIAIKTLGLYTIPVALHPEVSQNVTVNIARSEEEAQIQLTSGEALISKSDDAEMTPEAIEAPIASADEQDNKAPETAEA